jgi:hypothetical protein
MVAVGFCQMLLNLFRIGHDHILEDDNRHCCLWVCSRVAEWLLLTSETVPERGVAKVADSSVGLRPTRNSVMIVVIYKNVTDTAALSALSHHVDTCDRSSISQTIYVQNL